MTKFKRNYFNENPEHKVTYFSGRLTHDVPFCGHKFDPRSTPNKRSCQHCWFTYFATNVGKTAAAKSAVETFGEKSVVGIFGEKGAKFFLRFHHLMTEAAEQQRLQSESCQIGDETELTPEMEAHNREVAARQIAEIMANG